MIIIGCDFHTCYQQIAEVSEVSFAGAALFRF